MEGVKKVSLYRIQVKGHLDERWSDWFDGLEITNLENGEAMLSGEIVDQAALHGVLIKVRDLGLPLLAVSRVEAVQGTPGGGDDNARGSRSSRVDTRKQSTASYHAQEEGGYP